MSKPLVIMNYATDPTLTGGPAVGQPTRLRPSDASLKQGFYQERRIAAKKLSWILGTLDDNTLLAAHSALRTWQFVDIEAYSGFAQDLASFPPIVTYTDLSAGDRQKALAIWTGSAFSRSPEGSKWASSFASAISPATVGTAMFGGAPGVLVVLRGATSGDVTYSVNEGTSWTAGTVASGNVLKKGHYSAGLGRYFVVGTDAHVYSAATPTLLVSAPTVALLNSGISLAGSVSIASNGVNVVVCARASVSSNCTLWTSTNAGASWTATKSLIGVGHVTHNEALGLFCSVDNAGLVHTSIDGVTWTSAASSCTAANGFNFSSVASAGPAIVCPVQQANGFGSSGGIGGIAYSFNAGVNWNYWLLDATSDVNVLGANQRIYVFSPKHLWISGPLGRPGVEI